MASKVNTVDLAISFMHARIWHSISPVTWTCPVSRALSYRTSPVFLYTQLQITTAAIA